MKVVVAKTSGFCMGVRRAVETALDTPGKRPHPISTFGPLIHNPQVLDLLKERGINTMEIVPDTGRGTVLIRAHGVPPETKTALETAGFAVVDATCPRVIKVQTIIDRHARKGYAVIIIGDRTHPEVIGLMGYARNNGFVAKSIDHLDALPVFEKAIIVAQTTQNTRFFEEVKAWAAARHPHYKVFNTICGSTEDRQAEIRKLSQSVSAIVVVGGKDSGNTRRLAAIAKESGKPVYHVETETELDLTALSAFSCVGLTAGASTPNWTIKRVHNTLLSLPLKKKNSLDMLARAQKTLLLTNAYGALGAGALCYAASALQGVTRYASVITIAMLYVLNMHVINNLTGNKANHYNDPDRATFFKDHRIFLAGLSILAGIIYLAISLAMGFWPFLTILCMSVLGVAYNLKLPPKNPFINNAIGIRDIPGSKTLFVSFAWGVVTAIFPVIADQKTIVTGITFLAFVWVTCLVFVRTAYYDILDMQGDRIVGRETIPILLGEYKVLSLLKLTVIFAGLLILVASFFNWLPHLGYYLLACPAGMLVLLELHQRHIEVPGVRREFVIELFFMLSGVITFFWLLSS